MITDKKIEVGILRKSGISSELYYSAHSLEFALLDKFKKELFLNDKNEKISDTSSFKKELDRIFANTTLGLSKSQRCEIIFEEVFDQNNIRYGKELLSDLIFPISMCKYIHNTYYNFNAYNGANAWSCFIKIKTKITVPSLEKTECLLFDCKVADNNEVKAYQERFSKGIGHNIKKNKFINNLQELYNKNVFKQDVSFEPKKEIERIRQSEETRIMENIEYLLQQLKNQDIDSYNEFQSEYEVLLNNEYTTLNIYPFDFKTFTVLEGKIEAILSFGKKNANNILKYLNDVKVEYLYNFLTDNEKKTSLTLDEINKLNETFLKMKSEYKLTEQRNVLRNLALIYLMEIKENIKDINEQELSKSYFADNLKSIIIAMQELGVIDNNVIVSLDNELSTSKVIEIIKKIKFNKLDKDDAKKSIKKI